MGVLGLTSCGGNWLIFFSSSHTIEVLIYCISLLQAQARLSCLRPRFDSRQQIFYLFFYLFICFFPRGKCYILNLRLSCWQNSYLDLTDCCTVRDVGYISSEASNFGLLLSSHLCIYNLRYSYNSTAPWPMGWTAQWIESLTIICKFSFFSTVNSQRLGICKSSLSQTADSAAGYLDSIPA